MTIVTYHRAPLFAGSEAVELARRVLAAVREDSPLEIAAAVVLPDHLHFIWNLPPGDSDYSRRVGRFKALFTRAERGGGAGLPAPTRSRRKHRDGDVWQRRFWEHTIRDEDDLARHMDYVHYNPVKHGLVNCPHIWPYSSFGRWVERGAYAPDWGCVCGGGPVSAFDFTDLRATVGE